MQYLCFHFECLKKIQGLDIYLIKFDKRLELFISVQNELADGVTLKKNFY